VVPGPSFNGNSLAALDPKEYLAVFPFPSGNFGCTTTAGEENSRCLPPFSQGSLNDWSPIDRGQCSSTSTLKSHVTGNAKVSGITFSPNSFGQQPQPFSQVESIHSMNYEHEYRPGLSSNSTIVQPVTTAFPMVSPMPFDDVSNVAVGSGAVHDHINPELGWDISPHVFEPTIMNGGLWPSTEGSQFADLETIGHELSYPMQTPEATFMQGQPDGYDVWDDSGLATASPSTHGPFSAPGFVPNVVPQSPGVIPCNFPTCPKTFKRDSDRTRHEQAVHLKLPGFHLCPIAGCQKSCGKGYSRPDKVTEHLWKKHANLGFTKA
jgi:hypothetical protein